MTSFLGIALPLAERGFRVFPLIPKEKRPVKMSWGDHFDAATTDRAQLGLWDREVPRANVGISPDEIFCFVETDDEAALKEACKDLPPEIWDTTRVSARENRCYYIFRQTQRTRTCAIKDKSCKRDGKENLFEFKAYRTYVTGPGSIHPKTNAPYAVEWRSIPALPDILLDRLCQLIGATKVSEPRAMSDEVKRETATLDRFLAHYEVAALGDWFNKGKSWYRPIECPWSSLHENPHQGTSTCVVFTEGGGYGFDCKHRCAGKTWKEFRAELESRFPEKPKFCFYEPSDAQVTIGTTSTLTPDHSKPKSSNGIWLSDEHAAHLFATREELETAKPLSFFIDGFLPDDGVTAIAAPVCQRKSLIAQNMTRSLVTGEPLFGHFKVLRRPTRVLYLVPELTRSSLKTRLAGLGLMEYVGRTLFCRTLNEEGKLWLTEPALRPHLPGSVVFLDTAIRFMKGNENESQDMQVFSEEIFGLLRDGAASVVLLHHSRKTGKDAGDLTLDAALRGSGELGAFLTTCWATKLNGDDEYKSPSILKNVKQRDIQTEPFEITSDRETGILTLVEGSLGNATVTKAQNRPNKDGKDEERMDFLRKNPQLSDRDAAAVLNRLKMGRSREWVRKKREEMELESKSITYHVGGLTVGSEG